MGEITETSRIHLILRVYAILSSEILISGLVNN